MNAIIFTRVHFHTAQWQTALEHRDFYLSLSIRDTGVHLGTSYTSRVLDVKKHSWMSSQTSVCCTHLSLQQTSYAITKQRQPATQHPSTCRPPDSNPVNFMWRIKQRERELCWLTRYGMAYSTVAASQRFRQTNSLSVCLSAHKQCFSSHKVHDVSKFHFTEPF